MSMGLSRRGFVRVVGAGLFAGGMGCASPGRGRAGVRRLLFVSKGKTVLMNSDGTGMRVLEFEVPNQATWQPTAVFPDGRRLVLLSMEPRRDGPGRPFEEYYTQTPTHIWIHDLETGGLEEIAKRDRMAVFYTPALLVSAGRILMQVVRDKVGQIFSMNLDGTGAREFTRAGEGLPYGLSLSPDGRRVAFHLASPSGYQIWTSDIEGGDRVLIASHPEHLYFGPAWSPDGAWLAFQDCRFRGDPGHDWSDVCLSPSRGGGHRVVTEGQLLWFAASYGDLKSKGGGSNMVSWTRDGALLISRRRPDTRIPWPYRVGQPDVDHFNRDFKPEEARGGTDIVRLDPFSERMSALTERQPPVWDFRASESSDGAEVVFCRAETGGMPSVWVMDRDGGGAREITRGLDGAGADHPRWVG